MHRIVTIDVQRRFGLGVSQTLGILENLIKLQPLQFHPGQDIITGSVKDTVYPIDPVSDQSFPQYLDNRNTATNGRFIIEVHAISLGGLKNLLAVGGNQRFVRRDHDFSRSERFHHDRFRRFGSTHRLDHHMDARVPHDLLPARAHE